MKRPFLACLGLAAALHAALLAALAGVRHAEIRQPPSANARRAGALVWIESIAVEHSPAPKPEVPSSPASAGGTSDAPGARSQRLAARESVRGDGAGAAGVPAARESAASVGAEASGAEASGAAPGSAGEPSGGLGLSLGELGIGPSNNPFLTPSGAPGPTQLQRWNARLEHSLRAGLAEHDQKLGLGPEGPAISAVKSIVLDSATNPNTNGLLAVRTDATGAVVLVEVLSASNDPAGWQVIAKELERALAGKRLRVPAGSDGVRMEIAVNSRVQLPSGADPGLAVELFGQDLTDASERATRIKLLTPEIVVREVEIPGSSGNTMPMIVPQLTLAALLGDPVDIGAVARRVVSARLVSLETLQRALPPARAAPSP